MHRTLTITAVLMALGLAPTAPQQQVPQQPIRSGVELVLIDVQVSARNGQPIENLRPDQFEVNIDGKRLPIATLDFVRYNATERSAPSAGSAPPAAAPAASPGAAAAPRDAPRVLILAVDQASFMQASRQAPI